MKKSTLLFYQNIILYNSNKVFYNNDFGKHYHMHHGSVYHLVVGSSPFEKGVTISMATFVISRQLECFRWPTLATLKSTSMLVLVSSSYINKLIILDLVWVCVLTMIKTWQNKFRELVW